MFTSILRCLQSSSSAEGEKIMYCTYECKNTFTGIFIDGQAHCFENHLTNKHFSEEALILLKSKYTQTSFNRTDILTLLENVRKTLASSSGVHFENLHSLSDKACYSLTGFNKEQFENINSHNKL